MEKYEDKIYMIDNCKKVNVRKMPSVKSNSIKILDRYSSVTVLVETGDWYKVKFSVKDEEYEGYIMSKYVEVKS